MTDVPVYASAKPPAGAPLPRVSVVIPAYNAERTLPAALASVGAQGYRDFEVLVCDDASTDRTREVATEALRAGGVARWRVLALPKGNAAASRNHGIRAARGELVAFLDDDDSWEPTKLARSVAAIDAGPLDLLCHSEVWRSDDGAQRLRHYDELFDPNVPPVVSLFRNNPFSTSAVVVRRAHLLEAGLFDESLPSAEDYDLWIRLALIPGIRIGFLRETLGTYTLREGSESARIDRRLRALLAIGDRYAEPLARAAHGGLERWRYVGKTYFTTGIRYAQQGRRGLGLGMALGGFLMWPFRHEWVLLALRERRRRRALS